MSNKYAPHVHVLPEDDANREIALGFERAIVHAKSRNTQILPPSGGWVNVVADLQSTHIRELRRWSHRHIILMIDFDHTYSSRRAYLDERIEDDVRERIFVVGSISTPEKLRNSLRRTFEEIGEDAAKACSDSYSAFWQHDLLGHNRDEVARMMSMVRPILF